MPALFDTMFMLFSNGLSDPHPVHLPQMSLDSLSPDSEEALLLHRAPISLGGLSPFLPTPPSLANLNQEAGFPTYRSHHL